MAHCKSRLTKYVQFINQLMSSEEESTAAQQQPTMAHSKARLAIIQLD